MFHIPKIVDRYEKEKRRERKKMRRVRNRKKKKDIVSKDFVEEKDRDE